MTHSKPSDVEAVAKKSFKDCQFKKGKSGNSLGRPKRQLTEERPTDEELLSRLEAFAEFLAEAAPNNLAGFLVSVAAKGR
jgi:hypothetical protein